MPSKTKEMIAQDHLKTVLSYDASTGLFTRLRESKRYKIGEIAGCRAPTGYVVIRIDGQLYAAHRLAWLYCTGQNVELLDHINGDKSDNRLCNLRPANKVQNGINRGRPSNNTSGFKGVTWSALSKAWRAKTKINGRHIHIGLFDTKEAAHEAYKTYMRSHYGDLVPQ